MTAPPPHHSGGRLVVPIDMSSVRARVVFDVEARQARVEAVAEFSVDGPDGFPAFDLRQEVERAELDGSPLSPDALAHADLGAGGDNRVRVIDVVCEAGTIHRLALSYELGTPDAVGAMPLEWPDGDGVAWDLWMSDLEPGRYLEMWLPAGLCHDQLRLQLEVVVKATSRPHLLVANGLVANGAVTADGPGSNWSIRYPASFTSLSPMLVLAPADSLVTARKLVTVANQPLEVNVAAQAGSGADVEAAAADSAAWLAQFSERYGAWSHGPRFSAVMWSSSRGMEYDGATTACEEALEHEVFHSWFGRGVKPASARDGWIDEAMATWATSSGRAPGGRQQALELGLDEPPTLLSPRHPWSRYTPREAYAGGSRLLAGMAHLAGGPARLRSALAEWHHTYGGGQASTESLLAHLGKWCGRDLRPWWDRYVYGEEPRH